MSLVVQICKGSLWRKCCVICRLICSPVNWTFGNGCRRDVRGGCDLWNFYSESILKWTSVIHLFMHAPEKKRKQHHIHIHSPLQQLRTIANQSWMWFQSPNGLSDPCPTSEPYWSGAAMHHWEPMICRQRALERANVKPKPPTLTDPRQCRTESRANKRWSSRDVLVVLFYLPFRAIRCSLWYSSHMFFRWAQEWSGVCSRALCDCLFCFVWPTIPREYTWTHTVSLLRLSLSIYLSRLIAVIKQRAAAGRPRVPCYFPLLQPMLGGILPFSAQPGRRVNEVTGKRGNKRQTLNPHFGQHTIPAVQEKGRSVLSGFI